MTERPTLPLEPRTGYQVTEGDLHFLGIPLDAIGNLNQRAAPLGMSPTDFDTFRGDLFARLARMGIGEDEVDVRLQGSSSRFFSSWHKRLPGSVADVTRLVWERSANKDLSASQLDAMVHDSCERLFEHWPVQGSRPTTRPFDAMHVCKIDDPSDYDLQICSSKMITMVIEFFEVGRGVEFRQLFSESEYYGFLKKDYARRVFVGLEKWLDGLGSAKFGRPITWALFSDDGPKRNILEPHKSSHKNSRDWILSPPPGQ